MTVFLTILSVLLFLFIGILLLRYELIIEADTDARVFLKILFLKIPLYPKSRKKPKLRDYTQKNLSKKEKKEKRKAKAKKAKEYRSGQNKKNAAHSKTKEKMTAADIIELLQLVTVLARTFFLKFTHHLQINMTKVHITVASEDAAKTALTYGAVSGAVACLLELLDNTVKVKPNAKKDIEVKADFLSEASSVDIVASASLCGWQALSIAFSLAISFVKQKFF